MNKEQFSLSQGDEMKIDSDSFKIPAIQLFSEVGKLFD